MVSFGTVLFSDELESVVVSKGISNGGILYSARSNKITTNHALSEIVSKFLFLVSRRILVSCSMLPDASRDI